MHWNEALRHSLIWKEEIPAVWKFEKRVNFRNKISMASKQAEEKTTVVLFPMRLAECLIKFGKFSVVNLVFSLSLSILSHS